MIINNTYKFIYVHLEKCGGTSIEIALDEIKSPSDVCLGSSRFGSDLMHVYNLHFGEDNVKENWLWKHSSLGDIAKHYPVDNYFTWATVREPKDLMLSIFHFAERCYDNGIDLGDDWIGAYRKSNRVFASFVRNILQTKDTSVRTQVSRLSVDGRLAIDRAVDLANLNDEWPKILESIHIPPLEIIHTNITPRTVQHVYDKTLESLVHKHFEEDYDTLPAMTGTTW